MKFLDMFRNWKDVVEYPAQTVIFSEGDPAEVMYVILSGEIELTLNSSQLSTETAGSIIGEMAIIDSSTCSATATCLGDVRLARLNRDQFKGFISKNTDFSLHVMAELATRLRAVDKYISTQIEQSR